MKLRIAILGTRGIPNNYGGFEQITAYLSKGLVQSGHEVTVYNSHNHPYQKKNWNGVRIVHCFDPEYLIQTAGQFIYDLNCILHARNQNYDVILFMGYTSSSVWFKLFPKDSIIISNMDGMEWKRTKYSKPIRKFLKWAEKLAVLHSDFHIADSIAIKNYLYSKYAIKSKFIPYGARVCRSKKKEIMSRYQLTEKEYYLLMARMEPENNIDMILQGFTQSTTRKRLIVIGNTQNNYGKKMIDKYKGDNRIQFIGPLFDEESVHTLRTNTCLYFHGHSVGGTNPSLLEAMASRVQIAAHENMFNRAILQEDAFYFSDPADIRELIASEKHILQLGEIIENNFQKIIKNYSWKSIIEQYEGFICHCYKMKHNEPSIHYKRYIYQ
jgi:glycosyltransferase involved in cell wall biosynthesis